MYSLLVPCLWYPIVLHVYLSIKSFCVTLLSAIRCGFAYCAKKCLNLLPYIGDDENENSESDFEVRMCMFIYTMYSGRLHSLSLCVCCVALSFCYIVLPCSSFYTSLGDEWQLKGLVRGWI